MSRQDAYRVFGMTLEVLASFSNFLPLGFLIIALITVPAFVFKTILMQQK